MEIKIRLFGLLCFLLVLTVIPGCSGNKQRVLQDSEKVNKEYYTCPMHPRIHEEKPGSCPICGMDLVKKIIEEKQPSSDSSNDMKELRDLGELSYRKTALAGVKTMIVQKEEIFKSVKAYAYLDYVESSRKIIPARFSGRVEKLFIDKTGDVIKEGLPLFEAYSPDLIQAQNDFLIALQNTGKSSSKTIIASAKRKLELYGISERQIDDLKESGQAKLTMVFFSPAGGTVIGKKIQEGMYIGEGSTLYEIADLSKLWVIAEIFEPDLESLSIGSIANITLNTFPGETFKAKVDFIYPAVNPQTRTVKVRCVISSHNNRLKPQMYGEALFEKSLGKGIAVPEDAILMTGRRNIAWVKTPDGKFESRVLTLGVKFAGKYQVLSGLNEGDEIAVSGGFMIDSESRLISNEPN